jgi:hypothetical protein
MPSKLPSMAPGNDNAASTSGSKNAGGLSNASFWEYLSFSWVNSLIDKGFHNVFDEDDARYLLTEADDAPILAQQFEECYTTVKVRIPD